MGPTDQTESNSLNISGSFFCFILFIIPILRKFPKDQRYLIAQEIEKKSLALLENYQKAIYFPKTRAQILTENNFIPLVVGIPGKICADKLEIDKKK